MVTSHDLRLWSVPTGSIGCFSLPAFDCGSLSRTSYNDEAAAICCPTGTDATYMDGISSYKVTPLYLAKQLHRKTWKLMKRSLGIDFETRLRLYIIPLHINVVHTCAYYRYCHYFCPLSPNRNWGSNWCNGIEYLRQRDCLSCLCIKRKRNVMAGKGVGTATWHVLGTLGVRSGTSTR